MRRTTLVICVFVLIAGACATRSDRVTTAVSLPSVLVADGPDDVGTGVCRVTVGSGRGALVSSTVEGGPAAAVLLPNDLVVGFGGRGIATAGDLVAAVLSHSIGDNVVVGVIRDGSPLDLPIVVGESPEATGRPALGVIVTTLEDRVEPDALQATSLDGRSTRVAALQGQLWLLDPTGVAWAPLGVSVPSGPYLVSDGQVLVIGLTAEGTTTITSALDSSSVVADLGVWEPRTALAVLGDAVLLGAQETDADGTVIRRSVVAIDVHSGLVRWVWVADATATASVPIVGYVRPDGSEAIIALSAPDEFVPQRYVLISEELGSPVAAAPQGIPGDAGVLGWFDNDRLFAVSTSDDVRLIDPATGVVTASTVPVSELPLGLWPAGDGQHVLVEEGGALVLATVGSAGRRQLTASCGDTTLSDLGWSG